MDRVLGDRYDGDLLDVLDKVKAGVDKYSDEIKKKRPMKVESTKVEATKKKPTKKITESLEPSQYIYAGGGKAKFVKTVKEDKDGNWKDDYYANDGYYVIHRGPLHDVYKLEKGSKIDDEPADESVIEEADMIYAEKLTRVMRDKGTDREKALKILLVAGVPAEDAKTTIEGVYDYDAGGDEELESVEEAKGNADEIINKIQAKFPKMWIKPGEEFDGGSAVAWSGEGSEINGIPAFDYNDEGGALMADAADEFGFDASKMGSSYEMGVHKDLIALSDELGIYWEAHDPGTYLAYFVDNNEAEQVVIATFTDKELAEKNAKDIKGSKVVTNKDGKFEVVVG